MADIDENASLSGFQIGIIIGAIIALFKAPRILLKLPSRSSSTEQANKIVHDAQGNVRNIGRNLLNTLTPPDPIEESIAEGKEAARRRRAELGLDKES